MQPDPSKIEDLERAFARLAEDLANARRELASLRGVQEPSAAAAPRPAPPPPPRPAPRPRPPRAPYSGPNFEQLIGRYGAVAVGVLMVVLGAGALVSWAVRHGLLGPWVRVSLGALLAVALAATGWRLRARARGFGNSLLALALAVLHVVAWGAGPRLGLVPSWISLGLADAASFALAALALKENEEELFAVGLGGALLAPFVMSSGVPRFGVLALYGLIVLGAGIRTIGERTWWTAVGILMLFTALYTAAVMPFVSSHAWITREFAGAFAAAIALMALVWERRPSRPWIGATASLMMAIALVAHRVAGRIPPVPETFFSAPDIPLMAVAGVAITLAVVRDFSERAALAWFVGVAALPALFLSRAFIVTNHLHMIVVAGGIVSVWALLYAGASWLESGYRRGVLLALSGMTSLWALMIVLDSYPSAIPIVASAHAVLFAWIARREGLLQILAASAFSVFVAFTFSVARIATLGGGYTQTPFLSLTSAGAAAAAIAAYLSIRIAAPARMKVSDADLSNDAVARSVGATLAFVWGWAELGRAFSPDAATFLRILYLAICGVAAISIGWRRDLTRLRQIGLALSLLAALRAVVQATTIQNVALRVGTYLGAGAILLEVAWVYRRGGERKMDN